MWLAFAIGLVATLVTWIANLKINSSVTEEMDGLWIMIVGWTPFVALLLIRVIT